MLWMFFFALSSVFFANVAPLGWSELTTVVGYLVFSMCLSLVPSMFNKPIAVVLQWAHVLASMSHGWTTRMPQSLAPCGPSPVRSGFLHGVACNDTLVDDQSDYQSDTRACKMLSTLFCNSMNVHHSAAFLGSRYNSTSFKARPNNAQQAIGGKFPVKHSLLHKALSHCM